jgi:hypothetical protein
VAVPPVPLARYRACITLFFALFEFFVAQASASTSAPTFKRR